MRVPSLIILSSAALALLVKAEDVNVVASVSPTNIATDASKITENSGSTASTVVAATAAGVVVEGTGEKAAQVVPEAEKTYPVGNGIVYTKSSFFGDNKDNKATNGLQAKINAMSFFANMLGINLGIGIGGPDDKDKDGDKENESVDPWYSTPLYGDDGYEKRPVPSGCPALTFKDQMIWDQQGDSGEIAPNQQSNPEGDKTPASDNLSEEVKGSEESSTSGSATVPEVKADEAAKVSPEIIKRNDATSKIADAQVNDKEAAQKNEKSEVQEIKAKATVYNTVKETKTPKGESEEAKEGGEDEGEDEDEDDEDDEDEDDEDDEDEEEEKGEKKEKAMTSDKSPSSDKIASDIAEKVTAQGISICLLGGCDSDGKPLHKIHHKQKKFLKQFRGKSLKIDNETGCPIPSTN